MSEHEWEKGDALFGIRYWMQSYPKCKPKFRIYQYYGYHKTSKRFVFTSRDKKTVIYKDIADLHKGDFKPFLMELAKIEPYYFGEKS